MVRRGCLEYVVYDDGGEVRQHAGDALWMRCKGISSCHCRQSALLLVCNAYKVEFILTQLVKNGCRVRKVGVLEVF